VLIRPEEVAKVLQADSVTVSASGAAAPGQQSFRYEGANGRALTASFFFEKGKDMYDAQSFGRDDPAHYGTQQRCHDIGDSCYYPNGFVLLVLKGQVCFSLAIDGAGFDLAAVNEREALAKKIARRLY
jgi:hypothetical protein